MEQLHFYTLVPGEVAHGRNSDLRFERVSPHSDGVRMGLTSSYTTINLSPHPGHVAFHVTF